MPEVPEICTDKKGHLADCLARRAINNIWQQFPSIEVLTIELKYIFEDHPDWNNSTPIKAYINELTEPDLSHLCRTFDRAIDSFSFNLTDMGNAERLIREYGDCIRYCYERKLWLIWHDTHWRWDDGSEIQVLAQRVVMSIYTEAGSEENEDKRNKIADWAKTSESNARLQSMIEQAKPLAVVKLSSLDSNLWLLNCKNGTINLKTGELQEHNRLDLLTLLCPVSYVPNATSPTWETFLSEITDGKIQLIEYLQRAIGYSLTGDTREQVFFFCHGRGQNGKSTFLNIIRTLLGQYAMQIDPETFMASHNQQQQGHSENIANLIGKRLVLGSEIEDGRRLAVTKMKQHTGGESIRASHKHEKEFEFEVTYKIWLNGNHQPDVTDSTYSIWRRIKLIPFNVTIPAAKRDMKLKDTLIREHGAAILAWAVKGCLEWQQKGLEDTEQIMAATQQYHDEQDLLHDFISVKCITTKDAEVSILKKQLYAAYQSWCSDSSIDAVSQRTFNRKLLEKGYPSFISSGQSKWRYIRLLTVDEVKSTVDEVDIVDGNIGLFSIRGYIEKEYPLSRITSTVEAKNILPDESSSTLLEDCRKCGVNEWSVNPDGSFQCPCGEILRK